MALRVWYPPQFWAPTPATASAETINANRNAANAARFMVFSRVEVPPILAQR